MECQTHGPHLPPFHHLGSKRGIVVVTIITVYTSPISQHINLVFGIIVFYVNSFKCLESCFVKNLNFYPAFLSKKICTKISHVPLFIINSTKIKTKFQFYRNNILTCILISFYDSPYTSWFLCQYVPTTNPIRNFQFHYILVVI